MLQVINMNILFSILKSVVIFPLMNTFRDFSCLYFHLCEKNDFHAFSFRTNQFISQCCKHLVIFMAEAELLAKLHYRYRHHLVFQVVSNEQPT